MTPLPPGLRIALDPSVEHGPRGTLAGGIPHRVLRLSEPGRRALRELQHGADASPAARVLGRRLVDAGLAHPRPLSRAGAHARDVTVLVPVRDRPRELRRCLAALEPGTPLVVVDDGSRDPAAVAAIAARHGGRVVRRSHPGGPAAARNDGLAVVRTRLVAFLDSDCVSPRGWLDGLVGHFDDPVVAAVAPRVRPLPRDGFVHTYLTARSPLDMGHAEAGVEPGGRVPYVPTAALVVRAAALGEGFDEALRIGEDVDLVWRLLDAGWRVRYDPSVVVGHDEPTTLRAVLRRRFFYGTSSAPLAARHPGRPAPAVIRPWPGLLAVLLLSGRRNAAVTVGVQRSVLLARGLRRLGLPAASSPRWVAESTWWTVLSLGRYASTFALPVALAIGRRRPSALALVALPALDEWRRRATGLDPLRWTAVVLADDAAYGAGVCWSCLRGRTVRPLVPALARETRSTARSGSSTVARSATIRREAK